MELKKFISRHSFGTFLARVGSAFFNLLTSIFLARILGPTGRGEYALIILLPSLLAIVSDFGISTANVYFSGKKKYSASDLISNSIVVAAVVGFLVFVIMFFTVDYLQPRFFKNIPPSILKISCVILPVLLINGYLLNLLMGMLKIVWVNFVYIAQSIFTFALLFVILIAFEDYVPASVVGWLFVQVVFTIVIFDIIRKEKGIKIRLKFSQKVFKDTFSFGIKGYFANIASFFNYRLDMFILGYFLNSVSVGFYAVSVSVAEMIWYIPNSLSMVFYPVITSSGEKDANRITPVISRQTFLVTFIVSLVVAGLSNIAVTFLFGGNFEPSVLPLVLLLPGVVTLSVAKILSGYFCGIGKPGIPMVASILDLVVNIALNLVLIPRWGIAGAAVASSVSYSVDCLVLLVYYGKISRNNIFTALIPQKSDFNHYKTMLRSLKQ